MAYEIGGRADKLGNRYESRWVVKKILSIVKEEIDSIILEAIGEEEEGVDVIVINKDGSKEYHQCKGRNASKDKWSIADLNSKNILQNSKKHLDRSSTAKFMLISPISCITLHDIHERALNSNDCSDDFYNYQIKGSSLTTSFNDYCRYMNLNTSNSNDLYKAKDYLSRTYTYTVSDDLNFKKDILEKIELYFIGDSEIIYNLLANYIIEENLLGHRINNDMIIKYLQSKGILLRNLAFDNRIMPRINELNKEFVDSLNLINNKFIERKEVNKILSEIEDGNSVIIHGKAGYGKSGCVYDILQKLKSKNIGVLALKLDRRMPNDSAKKYGENLDLPASPIYCIHELYKYEKAVIIFDQLDAIRWTNTHSSTAIDVCKEMIRQVEQLNLERKNNISIVFVCRTYDYENDKSIKSLFKLKNDKVISNKMKWRDIKIDELDDSDVENVSGNIYYNFSKRMKEILKVPNNLYIWSQLDSDRKLNEITSSNDLIKSWIEQLVIKFEEKDYTRQDLDTVIEKMVKLIEKQGRLEVHKRLITNQSPTAINYLKSEGLINDNNDKISFVHQSFFDYFLVEEMLDKVLITEDIIEVIGNKMKQTPMKRYQIQMLLQIIQEVDFDLFVKLGHQILDSNKVRFFMKYLYLEVLSQSNDITKPLENLLNKYLKNERYKNDFLDTVFMNHPVFVLHLISNGTIKLWLDGSIDDMKLAISLLKSVNLTMPDDIVKVVNPYILKNEEVDTIIYNCMCDEIYLDSDEMFSLRIKLIQNNPKFLARYLRFDDLFRNKPKRALLILKEMVIYSSNKSRSDIYRGIDDIFYEINKIDRVDGKFAYEILMPLVPKENEYYSNELYGWVVHYRDIKSPARACVYILKKAMKDLIENSIDVYFEILEKYKNSNSILINEILLESSLELPEQYADKIINWISSNKGIHLLNKSGENRDELYHTKEIISKFTPHCSKDEFIRLENLIYNYHEKDEVERLKSRIDYNSSKDNYHVYWHYWGEIQYSLLPFLCKERLSIKSKNLIPVLERRFKNTYLSHKKSKNHSGSISSTISPNAISFSDKTWFDIITNKDIGKRKLSKWIETKNGFYETSIYEFAITFGNIAENDPIRFSKLILRLPCDIDNLYIYQIFKLIGLNRNSGSNTNIEYCNPIDIETCELIIKKFEFALYDINCAKALCSSIQNRSTEKWSNYTLDIISKLAKEHYNPEENEGIIGDEKNKDLKKFDNLWSNSSNCVRGKAAESIGSILWKRKELLDMFRTAVESLVVDKNPAVRLSAINCLCPIYNIDRDMAEKLTINLLKCDFRIAAHPYCRQLVYLMYKKYKNDLNIIIEKMFFSDDEYVCKVGAAFVGNLYIRYGEFKGLIYDQNKLNKNQKYSIISEAINYFDSEQYKLKCNEILYLFLNEDNDNGDLYNHLFLDKKIDIIEDKELIQKMLKSKISRRIIDYFIEYLGSCDKGILEFNELIFELCESIILNLKESPHIYESSLYGMESNISNLIMLLYEKTIGIDEINKKCLDILDLMFEYGIGNLRRKLSDVIKDY
ncbi:hypothetical protein [Intestinibacter bartlettii]|uniref:ATPase AAA-type core domain-containing protein n=1 Tax=Intestinibacter bartlettii CAG:1329 TaxID=1263063 RepID=R5XN75_9FIRM|nr:hypothetical protein [Intestinibacter bartlettii]CDA10181.1 putative uncharacterized protein [Intestinibacter bartlettii CAG:1329]